MEDSLYVAKLSQFQFNMKWALVATPAKGQLHTHPKDEVLSSDPPTQVHPKKQKDEHIY